MGCCSSSAPVVVGVVVDSNGKRRCGAATADTTPTPPWVKLVEDLLKFMFGWSRTLADALIKPPGPGTPLRVLGVLVLFLGIVVLLIGPVAVWLDNRGVEAVAHRARRRRRLRRRAQARLRADLVTRMSGPKEVA